MFVPYLSNCLEKKNIQCDKFLSLKSDIISKRQFNNFYSLLKAMIVAFSLFVQLIAARCRFEDYLDTIAILIVSHAEFEIYLFNQY